jgi:hypothetical protein
MTDGDGRTSIASEEYRGAWRVEAAARIRDLEGRLRLVTTDGDAIREERRGRVESSLGDARAALADHGRWDRLRAWWTGTAITAVWESVHDAQAELAQLERDAEVRASLPALLTWIRRAMPSGRHRARYETLLEEYAEGGVLDRAIVRQAYRDVIAANTERYSKIHVFRRVLAIVTALLGLLVAVLAVWHAIDPGLLSLCGGGEPQRCLTGPEPQGSDVAVVALVGAIGGLLAIAFALGDAQATPGRYDPRPWQAALKPVAGAATAIAGVLLIQADLIVGPGGSRSESLFLAYAAAFGFSQQLFTRFVDKRAETLIAGEDDEAGGGPAAGA